MALKLSSVPVVLWMLNLSSVTQRKFPCVAPVALPLPAAGPTLSVASMMGLISLPTWLYAVLPLPWLGWASGLSVLVIAATATAGPIIASLWALLLWICEEGRRY